MRMLLMMVTLLLVSFVACGDGDDDKIAPGAACVPTQQGAGQCQYGVCLKDIQCVGGKTIPAACAGPDCFGGKSCSGGMQCVPVEGGTSAFCLPPSICN